MIKQVQDELKKGEIDGWLLYDFKRLNPLALHFLKIEDEQLLTRRFFYWIPQEGEPVKFVSAVENPLTHLPGTTCVFTSWQELQQELKKRVFNKIVAMEYSPMGAVPEVSKVDAGTVELIRALGADVVSSGDLFQAITCVLTLPQVESHYEACKVLDNIAALTWAYIKTHLNQTNEWDVQQFILQKIAENNCVMEGSPIVAVNGNSADCHYMPKKETALPINSGDFILIDLWCKQNKKHAIFGDITRVAVASPRPSDKQLHVFNLVKKARDAATSFVKERFEINAPIQGWEVDKAARDIIEENKMGAFFVHRLGHNIHEKDHGPGAHNDNLETHEKRTLLPGTVCSIEPGIYIPHEFGVRLEYDLYLNPNGKVEITGGIQNELVVL